MHKSNDAAPNADDIAAIRRFRESLLAQGWPDSGTVERILGSNTNADAQSKNRRYLESKGNSIFAVWAGRDHGGYRYPPFQFLECGCVHPKLSALMDALARRPDLNPTHDKSGWERAFWLYQPRGRLSVQALALGAADFKEVREDPKRFAVLSDDPRTPADVFQDNCQAVIDLANDDADQVYLSLLRNNC